MASSGYLWVGLSEGAVLIYRIPHFEHGLPLISGKPFLASDGHKGSVRVLAAVQTKLDIPSGRFDQFISEEKERMIGYFNSPSSESQNPTPNPQPLEEHRLKNSLEVSVQIDKEALPGVSDIIKRLENQRSNAKVCPIKKQVVKQGFSPKPKTKPKPIKLKPVSTETQSPPEPIKQKPVSIETHSPPKPIKQKPVSIETHSPPKPIKQKPVSMETHSPPKPIKQNPVSTEIHSPPIVPPVFSEQKDTLQNSPVSKNTHPDDIETGSVQEDAMMPPNPDDSVQMAKSSDTLKVDMSPMLSIKSLHEQFSPKISRKIIATPSPQIVTPLEYEIPNSVLGPTNEVEVGENVYDQVPREDDDLQASESDVNIDPKKYDVESFLTLGNGLYETLKAETMTVQIPGRERNEGYNGSVFILTGGGGLNNFRSGLQDSTLLRSQRTQSISLNIQHDEAPCVIAYQIPNTMY